MIKKFTAAAMLSLSILSISASAANNVSEINIDVTVRNDGSAYISQHWLGTFDDGTENYIPIAVDGVSEFSVFGNGAEYTLLSDWDVDADFYEKAGKCGINKTANGIELCFGISQYGENSYTVNYVVDDFIKGYSDFDGTNYMLINPDMSTFPTSGKIRISLENGTALSEENSGIWAFGYNGFIEFENGAVCAKTNEQLTGSNSMIVMIQLNKGIINPKTTLTDSFETVKSMAFEGSDYDVDYEDVGVFGTIIGFLILLAIPAFIVWIIVLLAKRKREIKKFRAEAGYFRDVPNDGKIDVSHYLAQNFDVAGSESLIIAALMLSMINKGSLEPEVTQSVGFFGKTNEKVNLRLKKEPDTAPELSLYRLISESAGADGILQENELENYAYKNPKKINEFIDDVKKSGENEFIALGGFLGHSGNRIKDLSDKGKSELGEVMGLKKYLEDFTLISEREVTEAVIWKDYLVYAALFGIAERVIKQLKAVYPDKIPEIESYSRNVVIATSYYRSMYTSSQRALEARRASGGGGVASFGGGGGFSGGGSGGGSR